MADAAIAHVGDVEQAVDAAQVDEGAIIGDVLDDAVDHLAFMQRLDEAGALLGAGLFQNGAARDHNIAPAAVHLQKLERLRNALQRGERKSVVEGKSVSVRVDLSGRRIIQKKKKINVK